MDNYKRELKWKNWFEDICRGRRILERLYSENLFWALLFIATIGFLVLLLPFKKIVFLKTKH